MTADDDKEEEHEADDDGKKNPLGKLANDSLFAASAALFCRLPATNSNKTTFPILCKASVMW